MNKFLPILLPVLFALSVGARAQSAAPAVQPFGKIDMGDMQMAACDFEKDANAEVLLSIGSFYYGDDLKSIIEEYHKRVKIFNVNGNGEADIHIPYESWNHHEYISGIEAETINLVDGKTEITKLDKKLIYTTVIDNEYSEITFTMPNVKPGCIIEYKYKWNANYNTYLPTWAFQESIPVRYSELTMSIPDVFYFRANPHFSRELIKHGTSMDAQVLKIATHNVVVGGASIQSDQETESFPYNNNIEMWGMANVPSLHVDNYTSSFADNVQRIDFDFVSMKPIGGVHTDYSDTWAKVGYDLSASQAFGDQLNRRLSGEDGIISKAALLKTDDEKIAFVFDTVKSLMKWNGMDRWYTVDGTSKAWQNKTGNSTEINLIVYHLLKQLKIEAYPLVVSTRKHGKADFYSTNLYQFNRTVVYIPVDSTKKYLLDATGKYNLYNETPFELLNSFGLWIDKSKKSYGTVSINKDMPVRQVVLITAEIKPGGTMEGTAQLNSSSYDRINAITRYKTDGEKKYTDYLCDGDNNLKISSVKFENMEVDTVPLTQNIVFNLALAGSDENYIYLNSNIFTSLKTNPFLSESRMTDVYFGCPRSYSINGVYKLPAGYKIDALPKGISMATSDKSIIFKRIIAAQDGSLLIHYVIDIKKSSFNVNEYSEIHDFYKKMYEMLNEQVVLKKS